MKRIIRLVTGCCLVAIMVQAKTVNIASLGAVGDGKMDNTGVLQRAIDACSEETGTVIVPEGKFLTGPVRMKSNVNLHLESGAVLLGIPRLEAYHEAFPDSAGSSRTPALIFACNQENIAVTGYGTIDGQGGHAAFQHGNDADGGPKRPKIIYFTGCKNVRIQDICLRNAAYWTQHYEGCDGVIIRGVSVYGHCNYNNDGLDIDSKNVLVSDCRIDTDDDALCLKSERASACENVTVTNCVLGSNCNAVKLGTASSGGFKNIAISNCVIRKASEENFRHWRTHPETAFIRVTQDTSVISGIALEAVDGGVLDGVAISNVVMTDVQTPVFIRLGNRRQTYSGNRVSVLRNVCISHVVARAVSALSSSITGIPGGEVENVCISHVQVTVPGGGTAAEARAAVPEAEKSYPENRMFGQVLPASGFYVRHARNVRFDNVRVITEKPDARPAFVYDDVRNDSCK